MRQLIFADRRTFEARKPFEIVNRWHFLTDDPACAAVTLPVASAAQKSATVPLRIRRAI